MAPPRPHRTAQHIQPSPYEEDDPLDLWNVMGPKRQAEFIREFITPDITKEGIDNIADLASPMVLEMALSDGEPVDPLIAVGNFAEWLMKDRPSAEGTEPAPAFDPGPGLLGIDDETLARIRRWENPAADRFHHPAQTGQGLSAPLQQQTGPAPNTAPALPSSNQRGPAIPNSVQLGPVKLEPFGILKKFLPNMGIPGSPQNGAQASGSLPAQPSLPWVRSYQDDEPGPRGPDFSKQKEALESYPKTQQQLRIARSRIDNDPLVNLANNTVLVVGSFLGGPAGFGVKSGTHAAMRGGLPVALKNSGKFKSRGSGTLQQGSKTVVSSDKTKSSSKFGKKRRGGESDNPRVHPKDNIEKFDDLEARQRARENLYSQNESGIAEDIATYGSAYFAYLFSTGTFENGLPGNGVWVGSPQQWAELDEDEKEFARELMKLGLRVGRGSTNPNGRNADFTVNGRTVELKTVNTYGKNTIKNRIERSVGQGEYTIIDARGTGYTRSEALAQIKRAHGNIEGGIRGQITVLTDQGPVSF